MNKLNTAPNGESYATMVSEEDEMYEIGRKAWKSASRAAKHMSKHSRIVNPSAEKRIPRFDEQEIVVGKMLGSGGFNNVYELEEVKLLENPLHSNHSRKMISDLQTSLRSNVAERCYHEASGSSRYAIKFLSKDTLRDPDRFYTGAADLVVEAKFLASLDHPNIVKLRGMAAAGTAGFATCRPKGYFLLLDRLQCTLDDKVEEWKELEHKTNASLQRKLLDRSGKKQQQLLSDRLKVALEVASALNYLHENNVIYRDLKPDNIGFDIHGDVKIFDFGLAKELDDSMRARGCDDFYELSGNTGSLRYMAPEVALSENYNLTADVYSFGLLLWQIASLDLPYDGMSRADHSFCVVKGNERPTLDSNWPPTLCVLMKRCWDPDPCLRPSMDSVHKLLKREIVSLRGGDDTEVRPSRRRSSLFFRRGSASNNEDTRGSLGNLLSRVSSMQGSRPQTPSRQNSTEVSRRHSPNPSSGNTKQPRGKSPKRSLSHQPLAA